MHTNIERLFTFTLLILFGLLAASVGSVFLQKLITKGDWAIRYVVPVTFLWMSVVFIHLGIISFIERIKDRKKPLRVIGAILGACLFVFIAINVHLNPERSTPIGFIESSD